MEHSKSHAVPQSTEAAGTASGVTTSLLFDFRRIFLRPPILYNNMTLPSQQLYIVIIIDLAATALGTVAAEPLVIRSQVSVQAKKTERMKSLRHFHFFRGF
jgi:hypothetical protein